MGAALGRSRPTAITSQRSLRPRVSNSTSKPKSVEKVPANAGRETDVIGELARTPTVGCQVPTLEVAEASSRDNNKRVEEARRARVAWLEMLRRECASEEEFETARSRPTWAELDVTSSSSCAPDGPSPAALERLREENRRHFQHLVNTPRNFSESRYKRLIKLRRLLPSQKVTRVPFEWFYFDFGGRLEVGKKIGGGGQADIHEAVLDGRVQEELVLKVFKSDYYLADLQRSWVKDIARIAYRNELSDVSCCIVQHGTLLQDGRFVFLFRRYWGDLRKAIDLVIVKDKTHQKPPFQSSGITRIIYSIASGMEALHKEGILHRDLKAANCLLRMDPIWCGVPSYGSLVADFDSPEGVVGTGFWRAPEVLLALKTKMEDLHSNREVWTEKVDVYSYAMTCYEVLTGCIPFEGRALNDYDGVIGGERPPLPDYVNPKLQELVRRCWHSEPSMRPTFEQIRYELRRI